MQLNINPSPAPKRHTMVIILKMRKVINAAQGLNGAHPTRCGDTIAASTVLTSLAPWSDKFNIYTMYNTIVSIYNRNRVDNQAQTCDAMFFYIAN